MVFGSAVASVNASVIDENGPNPMVVGKAFGFMLFGNDGFMTPGIENLAVDGCKVSSNDLASITRIGFT